MDETKEQYVYVMSNPSFPNRLKIGWTKKHPNIRAKELNTTGLPTPFVVEFVITTYEGPKVETLIHNHIKKYRVTQNREFFQISKHELSNIIVNDLNLEVKSVTDISAPINTQKNNNNQVDEIKLLYEELKKEADEFFDKFKKENSELVVKEINNKKYVSIIEAHGQTPLKFDVWDCGDEKRIKNDCFFINQDIDYYKETVNNLIHNYNEIKNRIGIKMLRSDNKELKELILTTQTNLHKLKSKYEWELETEEEKYRKLQSKEQEIKMNSEVEKIFPNYKEDKLYGGTQILIKVNICEDFEDDVFDEPHINFTYIDTTDNSNYKYITNGKSYYNNLPDKSNLISMLINRQILKNDTICDYNKIVKKIESCKKKKKYEEIFMLKDDENELELSTTELCNILSYDTILIDKKNTKNYNVSLYQEHSKTHFDIQTPFTQGCLNTNYNVHSFMKISNKLIHRNFLRKMLPYCLEINNTSNEVYLVNRDYEYINLNTKCLSDLTEDYDNFEREYLYDDGSNPWYSVDNYKKVVEKFNNFCLDKRIINGPFHPEVI